MSEAMILTNAVLKDIMTDAVLCRGQILKDFDDVSVKAGVYRTRPDETLNFPPGVYGYGIAMVERADTFGENYFIQRYYSDRGECCYRWRWNTTWRQWRKVASEPLT